MRRRLRKGFFPPLFLVIPHGVDHLDFIQLTDGDDVVAEVVSPITMSKTTFPAVSNTMLNRLLRDFGKAGTVLSVEIDGARQDATVTSLSFYTWG